MLFLLTYIEFRAVKFFRLLNSDWSIQISDAAAVCKVISTSIHYISTKYAAF